jgi:hypothetical protein
MFFVIFVAIIVTAVFCGPAAIADCIEYREYQRKIAGRLAEIDATSRRAALERWLATHPRR